jgi:hypothetical protein
MAGFSLRGRTGVLVGPTRCYLDYSGPMYYVSSLVSWGFHETTPCRPGGGNGPPSKCAVGTGDARGKARLQYNEFGNQIVRPLSVPYLAR